MTVCYLRIVRWCFLSSVFKYGPVGGQGDGAFSMLTDVGYVRPVIVSKLGRLGRSGVTSMDTHGELRRSSTELNHWHHDAAVWRVTWAFSEIELADRGQRRSGVW